MGTERRRKPIGQAVASQVGCDVKIDGAVILNRIVDWGAFFVGEGSQKVLRRIGQAVYSTATDREDNW